MKRFLISFSLIVFTVTALWAASKMSVQVNNAQVRRSPSFLGAIVTELSYGDRVEIIEEGRGWLQVRSESGSTGWMQESALTSKKVVLSSGGNASSGASSDEVALAGKGFNADIEKEYKAESDLDFTWVDKMTAWEVPTETLVAFLEEGNLEGAIQ